MSGEAPQPEPLVDSETIFTGKIVTLKVDRVRVAPETVVTREVVVHRGSVTIVPRLPDGRVVMIRQYRHPAQQTLWELPSGTLEEGEDPAECARRELVEEVGYQAGRWQRLFSCFLTPGYCTELAHFYLASDLRPVRQRPQTDERITPVPVLLAEAVAMVTRGEVQNIAAVCGILATARRARESDNGPSG